MHQRKSLFFTVLLLSAWLFSISGDVLAQGARRIVISSAAGGTLDNIARKLSQTQAFRSSWGNPIVTENLSGQNGMVAIEHMRSLPGDGSTILTVFVAESGPNAAAFAQTVTALADLMPIAYLGSLTGPNGKSWYGVYGPPGMTADTARRLESVLQSAMQSSDIAALIATLAGFQQDRAVSAASLAQLTGAGNRTGGQTAAQTASHLPGVTSAPAGQGGPATNTGSSTGIYPHGSNAPSICEAPDGYENARPARVSTPHNPANSAMHCVCLTRDKPVNGVPMYKFVNRCSFPVNRYIYYRPGLYLTGDGGVNDSAYEPATARFTYYFCRLGRMNGSGSMRNGEISCY